MKDRTIFIMLAVLFALLAITFFIRAVSAQDCCLLRLSDTLYYCRGYYMEVQTYEYDLEAEEWSQSPTIQYVYPNNCDHPVTKIRTWHYINNFNYTYVYQDKNEDGLITDDERTGTQTVHYDYLVDTGSEQFEAPEQGGYVEPEYQIVPDDQTMGLRR